MSDKSNQRKICLNARDSLSYKQREDNSKIICERLLPFLQGKTILSYSPIASEVDVSMINTNFKVAYPLIRKDRQMEARIPNASMMKNRYGMPNQIIRLDFNPSRDYFVEIKTSTIKRKKSNKTASSATSSAKSARIPSEIESDLLPPDPQEQDEIDKLINS